MKDSERTLTYTGSHYEVGQQIGQQYKQWGKTSRDFPNSNKPLYQQQLALYQKYFPSYLELLEGVACGAHLDTDTLLQSFLTGFLNLSLRPRNTCSVIGLHRNDKVFIGRNYDWRETAQDSARHIVVNFSDGAYSFNALSDMGVWECNVPVAQSKYDIDIEDAWNEHGLFVCLNGAPGESTNTGMCCTHIVQAVTEQCKNTAEAVELISRIPCNDPKFFTIIDRSGDMAVVEKQVHKKAAVVRSTDSLIVTNHFQSKEYSPDNLEIFGYAPFHSTFARREYLALNRIQLTEPSFERVHDIMLRPPVLQNWRGKANGDVVTVWSAVIELTSSQYTITYFPQNTASS